MLQQLPEYSRGYPCEVQENIRWMIIHAPLPHWNVKLKPTIILIDQLNNGKHVHIKIIFKASNYSGIQLWAFGKKNFSIGHTLLSNKKRIQVSLSRIWLKSNTSTGCKRRNSQNSEARLLFAQSKFVGSKMFNAVSETQTVFYELSERLNVCGLCGCATVLFFIDRIRSLR